MVGEERPEFVRPMRPREEHVGNESRLLMDRDDAGADVLGERVEVRNRESTDRIHGARVCHERGSRVMLGVLAGVALCASICAVLSGSPRAATTPFFFLQLSDPQFGMYTANQDFAQETANFEFAIAAANRLRPAFVVVTGDLVNRAGDAEQIAEYRRVAATLDSTIPLYNVPGNHDVENVPTPQSIAAYTGQFGPDH